ncbi:hypothetical protein H9P43_008268 [Blastocladiella emersonii ATCC 22665]|nr:hypothetical protein H9P43_008268 [Blastocladiella emersonii ATCC 22665]
MAAARAVRLVSDQYGFKIESQFVTRAQWDKVHAEVVKDECKQLSKWEDLLRSNKGTLPERSDKLKKMIRKGIPPKYRRHAWLKYSGAGDRLVANPGTYLSMLGREQHNLSKGISPANEFIDIIERDLHRTFPDNLHYKRTPIPNAPPPPFVSGSNESLVTSLRRVLVAFSFFNTEIGYCQSLNYIVGLLLLFMSEEEAFWTLVVITEDLLPAGMYSKSLSGTVTEMKVFKDIVKDKCKPLLNKVSKGGIVELDMLISPWFLTIYINILPVDEGSKILYRIAIAVLKLIEDEVLKLKDEMEVVQFIQNAPKRMIDVDKLMKTAFQRFGSHAVGQLSHHDIDKKREKQTLDQDKVASGSAKTEFFTRSTMSPTRLPGSTTTATALSTPTIPPRRDSLANLVLSQENPVSAIIRPTSALSASRWSLALPPTPSRAQPTQPTISGEHAVSVSPTTTSGPPVSAVTVVVTDTSAIITRVLPPAGHRSSATAAATPLQQRFEDDARQRMRIHMTAIREHQAQQRAAAMAAAHTPPNQVVAWPNLMSATATGTVLPGPNTSAAAAEPHFERTSVGSFLVVPNAATAASARPTPPASAPSQLHPQFRSKPVARLSCRHCARVVCTRGMKAILLADTRVELYSTDSPVAHATQMIYDEYVTTNCQCRIRDVACLGCGNAVGYHVTTPCSSCLKQCNNGHFVMFNSDGVVAHDRADPATGRVQTWGALPAADRDGLETAAPADLVAEMMRDPALANSPVCSAAHEHYVACR